MWENWVRSFSTTRIVEERSRRVDSADFRSFFMFFFCCLYSEEVEVLVVFIRRR